MRTPMELNGRSSSTLSIVHLSANTPCASARQLAGQFCDFCDCRRKAERKRFRFTLRPYRTQERAVVQSTNKGDDAHMRDLTKTPIVAPRRGRRFYETVSRYRNTRDCSDCCLLSVGQSGTQFVPDSFV